MIDGLREERKTMSIVRSAVSVGRNDADLDDDLAQAA